MQFESRSPHDAPATRIRRAGGRGRAVSDARSRAASRPFDANADSLVALVNGVRMASNANERPAEVAAVFTRGGSQPWSVVPAKSRPDETASHAREGARPQPSRPATEERNAAPRGSDWRRSIAGAISSASAALVDGLALSALAVHSEFIWLPTAPLGRDEAEETLAPEGRAATGTPLWGEAKSTGVARPRSEGTAQPGWRAWAAALPARVWSSLRRRARLRRLQVGWDALDERTLRDIGICRYEINLILGNERHRY